VWKAFTYSILFSTLDGLLFDLGVLVLGSAVGGAEVVTGLVGVVVASGCSLPVGGIATKDSVTN